MQSVLLQLKYVNNNGAKDLQHRGLFGTFELRVLTVDCLKITGANSPIFKIAGTKAPIAPVLNRPLQQVQETFLKVLTQYSYDCIKYVRIIKFSVFKKILCNRRLIEIKKIYLKYWVRFFYTVEYYYTFARSGMSPFSMPTF